jgi:hypothetical protein
MHDPVDNMLDMASAASVEHEATSWKKIWAEQNLNLLLNTIWTDCKFRVGRDEDDTQVWT